MVVKERPSRLKKRDGGGVFNGRLGTLRKEGTTMRRICARIIGVVVFVISLVPTVYGNEMEAVASGDGGDPTAVLLVEQGEQLMRSGNQMEGALASFEMAIGVDPELSKAYLQASAAASQLGDNEKAISYLEELRRRKPGDREVQRLLAGLEGREGQGSPIRFLSSGFLEFGVAALLGWVFLFFVAGREFGSAIPLGTAAVPVERPYLIYPLLKIIWQGTRREFLTVRERRHRSLHWQPGLHAPCA